MDTNTLIMPVIIIGFGLFAGAMFVYRNQTAGEKFDLQKFLPTMGIGALAAVVLWFASGTLPGLDQIFAEITVLAPGGTPSIAVIIAALLTIYNGYVKAGTTTSTSNVASTGVITGTRVRMADGRMATVNSDGTFTYDDGSVTEV